MSITISLSSTQQALVLSGLHTSPTTPLCNTSPFKGSQDIPGYLSYYL